MEDWLYLAPSIIPGAGKGLYTARRIHKGDKFAEYTGYAYNPKTDKEPDDTTYVFAVNDRLEIDGKSMARYANDARGLVRLTGLQNNCEFSVDEKQGRVFLLATQDIPPHSEILVNYGSDYWSSSSRDLFQRQSQARSRARRHYYMRKNTSPPKAKRQKVVK